MTAWSASLRPAASVSTPSRRRSTRAPSSAPGCGGTPTLSACNDGNVCTVADTCFNGACVGVPNTCDDANVCTTDFCTPPTVGCGHLNNALACNDGNAATVGDSCSGSKCMGFTRD